MPEGQRLVREAAAGMQEMLSTEWIERVRDIAHQIYQAEHLFVIGRGLSYPTALEAALKIKEVSYIHAEGFAAGELKHGVIALVEQGTPCVVYAPNDETHADVISGAMELKARGGHIIGIGPASDPGLRCLAADARCRRCRSAGAGVAGPNAGIPCGIATRKRSRQAAQSRQERHGEVMPEEHNGIRRNAWSSR